MVHILLALQRAREHSVLLLCRVDHLVTVKMNVERMFRTRPHMAFQSLPPGVYAELSTSHAMLTHACKIYVCIYV